MRLTSLMLTLHVLQFYTRLNVSEKKGLYPLRMMTVGCKSRGGHRTSFPLFLQALEISMGNEGEYYREGVDASL